MMQNLPDDIIILISQHLTLLDVFRLRLTNRRLAALIVSYSGAIGPSVARNTFPTVKRLLRRDTSTFGAADFAWLKGLVPRYLGAVVIDRYRQQGWNREHGILTEGKAADALRAKAEKGWRVFNELSFISKEVYRLPVSRVRHLPLTNRLKRVLGWRGWRGWRRWPSRLPKTLKIMERREHMILERRLRYLETLDAQTISDYRFMYGFMLAAFLTNYDLGQDLERGCSWVNWFIMHEGPALFWEQWAGKIEDFVRESVQRAWTGRSERQILIEKDAIYGIESFLATVKNSDPYPPSCGMNNGDFILYRTRTLEQYRVTQQGLEETLDDVPYVISFRDVILGR